jgi:hypothetical protein
MRIVRNIAAVVVGYLVFAVSALLLFKLGGIDPHAEAGIGTMLLVVAFGAIFSFVAGFVAKVIAASRTLSINVALAALMFAFAAFSSLQSTGDHYTQFAAMFIFAPVSILGGLVSKKVLSRS